MATDQKFAHQGEVGAKGLQGKVGDQGKLVSLIYISESRFSMSFCNITIVHFFKLELKYQPALRTFNA